MKNRQGHTLYGCVDWNIHFSFCCCFASRSHPVWVCGLKQKYLSIFALKFRSHPVWVCGLKLEIIQSSELIRSHTLYGCVDWNIDRDGNRFLASRHTLYGCVDWNIFFALNRDAPRGHTLYGCVDWNVKLKHADASAVKVTPCMGVWIETILGYIDAEASHVTPCMGVWIETCRWCADRLRPPVTPCMGVWIETQYYA